MTTRDQAGTALAVGATISGVLAAGIIEALDGSGAAACLFGSLISWHLYMADELDRAWADSKEWELLADKAIRSIVSGEADMDPGDCA